MQFSAIYGLAAFPFDDNFATAYKKVFVNAAQHEIAALRPWSWRLATSAAIPLVASQQAYTLAGTSAVLTDYDGLFDVQLELTASGARKTLRPADQQVFDDISAHSRVNGVPSVYTTAGGTAFTTPGAVLSGGTQQLLVWPIPVATAGNGVNVFIRYWRSLASIEMTADTDLPLVPAAHHMAIVELAQFYGYTTLGLGASAKACLDAVNARLEKMVMEDEAVYPPRDANRLVYAQPPSLQAQGHITSPRLPLPVPAQPPAA